MNNFIKIIMNRRSRRNYTEEKVNDHDLKTIVEAGLSAPSAWNSQPWHFTVIENVQLIDKLSELTKEILKNSMDDKAKELSEDKNFHVFYHAPVVIIISGDIAAPMYEEGCAAATENMLLAAEALDLGSGWIGMISLLFEGDILEKNNINLNIPIGYKPLYAITIGHKDSVPDHTPELKENLVTYIK